MREITEIILHCTATRPDWWAGRTSAEKLAEVRRWHVTGNGWRDIGYHYLIDRDGTVVPGRPLEQTGAHVAGRNTGTIGISLFGGHGSAASDAFSDHFTPEQDRALRALVQDLRRRFPAVARVSGHNQYAAKACPGFSVPQWIAGPAQASAPTSGPTPVAAAPAGQAFGWLFGLLARLFGART
ncbi:N-acetylmuramoyl-L-alanine amidase [Pseudogemmobacter sonorensis]|uniref:N-acetylmuramoyl-L-alanine amidase n=1 Tax=Pseudogemmobacter sonorensis TaxID=2989681 RepID=UPI003691192E